MPMPRLRLVDVLTDDTQFGNLRRWWRWWWLLAGGGGALNWWFEPWGPASNHHQGYLCGDQANVQLVRRLADAPLARWQGGY